MIKVILSTFLFMAMLNIQANQEIRKGFSNHVCGVGLFAKTAAKIKSQKIAKKDLKQTCEHNYQELEGRVKYTTQCAKNRNVSIDIHVAKLYSTCCKSVATGTCKNK